MNKKGVRNQFIRAGMVVGSVLFGIAMTTVTITNANAIAISNELHQPTSEIVGKNPDAKRFDTRFDSIKDLQVATKEVAKNIQREGSVLLENKGNALPLSKNAKVSLFGWSSSHIFDGGRGSSQSDKAQAPVQLKEGLESAGLQVNPDLTKYYKDLESNQKAGLFPDYDVPFHPGNKKFKKVPTIAEDVALQAKIDEYSDAGIYIISRTGSEATDIERTPRNFLLLKDNEKDILTGMQELKAAGKLDKIIVLLNCTNQIQQNEFLPYDIDAMLWCGHTGINGTEAIGEILNGTINPSGRLVDTFWYNHEDNPVVENYGVFKYANADQYKDQLPLKSSETNGYNSYVPYQEGVYLGYRYAETRYFDKVTNRANVGEFDYDSVIYRPFGYGQSYTTFELSNYSSAKKDGFYEVSVDVKNTGALAGKDVVQIYAAKPYTAYDIENHIEKPAVELVAFGKTDVLEPNKSQTLKINVDAKYFASYDANKAKTYVVSEGDYCLTAAHDAHEATKNVLQKLGNNVGGNDALVSKYHLEQDTTSYSKSAATGKEITNLFDQYDINKYEGRGDNKLDFITRNNWVASDSYTHALKLTDAMVARINAQQNLSTIPADDGAYPTYEAENYLGLFQLIEDEEGNKIEYDDPKWDLFLDQLSWDETVELVRTGLRLTKSIESLGKPQTFDHNGPTGLTQTYDSKGKTGIAIEKNDPDKGLHPIQYPSIPVLAATFNVEIASDYGEMLAEDALWCGYNGLYGVGLNSHRSPYSGRHFEYFSEDPILAGFMAASEVKALQAGGCNAYIKHFALNDQESQRFGINVWSNEQALREISLRPFELAVTEGGAMNVMTSFSRIGLDFAPASHALQTDFLRGECGMKGLAVTDMYTLGYEQESMFVFLMAGTDIPDGEIKVDLYEQFKEGHSKVAWQMREAAHRIMYQTAHCNAMNGFDENTRVVKLVPPWQQAVYGLVGGASAILGGFAIWGIVSLILDNKSKLFKKSK